MRTQALAVLLVVLFSSDAWAQRRDTPDPDRRTDALGR